MNLPKIAQHLRTLHFYAQHAHHVTKGVTFMQDHEHFGSLYEAYAAAYDTVVETAIGNKTKVDEFTLAIAAAEYARKCAESDGTSHVKMFQTLLDLENELQTLLTAANRTSDLGDQNLLAQLHQDSKHRANYKIAQRLK